MKESIMQHENESLWRKAVALLVGTALALVIAGLVARARGAETLSYVLGGMGICLLLGFLTRASLRRRAP